MTSNCAALPRRRHEQFAVRADNGDVWVKSLEVIAAKP
jgi:hypothetical protein